MLPRVIAFEGVDGAGKSTVIHRVAQFLASQGQKVFLPRTGKEHNSRPTRMIRRLTRDQRNLELDARAEMLLYCAREAQILEEMVKPALARGETVLLDRSLLTPLVLGAHGRGLPRDLCESAISAAAAGLEPDKTLIFDVHPRTSRIRKRVAKVREHVDEPGGRKGLAGSGLKERVRDGYAAIAQERGYPVFHVERISPDTLAERVLEVLVKGASPEQLETPDDAVPAWQVDASWDFMHGIETQRPEVALFLTNGLRCARALRAKLLESEPELVAWSMDEEDPLCERAARREPAYALRGWGRRPFDADDLRLKLIDQVPTAALNAMKYVEDPRVDELRTKYAEQCPGAVVASLTGRDDEFARELRARHWKQANEDERSSSITFCSDASAWNLRRKLFEKDPVRGLTSLRGVLGTEADRLIEAYAPFAPKSALRAVHGRSDEFAYDLRRQLLETGREIIDSIRGLDDDDAWALRDEFAEQFPSTVIHSMQGTTSQKRGPLLKRCLEAGRGDLHVQRRLQALNEYPERPEWARYRATLADD